MILALSVFYYVAVYINPKENHIGYQIDESITWPQFIRDCGKSTPENTARRNY